MTGNRCLLDTSIIIHFFRNNELISRLKNFEEVYANSVVIGELYYGAYASLNPSKHIKQIESFLSNCTTIPLGSDTGIVYGRLKSELKKNGTPIPENDIWIAASAIEYDLPLFTTDKHFELMKLDLISL